MGNPYGSQQMGNPYGVAQQQMEVMIPADHFPGMLFMVYLPDGRPMNFEVPNGMGPGMSMMINVQG